MTVDRTIRRLSAIVAADVVGYSRLMEANEASTLASLRDLKTAVIDPLIAEHGGRIVKWMGDGALVEFGSVVDAVAFAVAMQKGLAERQTAATPESVLLFRIGINLGDVVVEGDDLLGDGVNIAARLEQLCPPGGVMVSGTAYDHLQGKLGLPLDFAGDQQVKNISRPVRTYNVRIAGLALPKPTRAKRRRLKGGTWAASAAMLVLGFIGVVTWLWMGQRSAAISASQIAVLPFENRSGDEASARIADGITDDVLTDLSRFKNLGVVARGATDRYQGKSVDPRIVGKDLNVRYVLSGTLQKQGDRVRINAQLVDSETGSQLWSERYDRPAGDLFAVQSEIADRVANALGGYTGLINKSDMMAAKRKRPSDLGAYELYLLGVDEQHKLTEDNWVKAIDYFQRAIIADPNLARAHTAVAWTALMRADVAPDPSAERRLLETMRESAQHAVELDSMDADARASLGWAYGRLGDIEKAEVQYSEALKLSPNSFDILTFYANWADKFDQGAEGAAAADRAIRLNPAYPAWAAPCFAFAFMAVGRFEDALKAMTHMPEELWGATDYITVAINQAETGRASEAKQLVDNAKAKYPDQASVEAYALRPGWTSKESEFLIDGMNKAGFPPCAPENIAATLTKRLNVCKAAK